MDDPGLVPEWAYGADPQADWYATEFDAVGRVPWWPPDRSRPTLGQLLSYVSLDLARHAGQADILREQIDGAVGWWGPGDNLPQGYDWPAYVAKLTAIAERF